MKSRRLIASPKAQEGASYSVKRINWKGPSDVRFVSKADICGAQQHVRFTPNSDMCSARAHVCFGPKADIARLTRSANRTPQHCNPTSVSSDRDMIFRLESS